MVNSLQGCRAQYNTMTNCLVSEKNRIKRKELDLRARVFGLEQKELKEEPITIQEKEKVAMGMKS